MEEIKEIKNFNKFELNVTYSINGHELVLTNRTTHKFGHYLYTGSVDTEMFEELNSPRLKKMLGIDTLEYNRGGESSPKLGKEITEEIIKLEVAKIATRINKYAESLRSQISEDAMVQIEKILFDEIKRKQDEVKEKLYTKLLKQQKTREAKEQKARIKEKEETLKERCAKLGTTLKHITSIANVMGVDVEIMITNMEGCAKKV